MAMNEDRAYAGILMRDGTELTHYGVKGMKWGKKLFGKVKGVFGKPNPMTAQMQNAMKPPQQEQAPAGKKRSGKKVNTVNGTKTGVLLTNRASANSAQAVKTKDVAMRTAERSTMLQRNSATQKKKKAAKAKSYFTTYQWHHN